MDFYRKNIRYLADSYEIYEAGQRPDAGVCNVDIRCVVNDEGVRFSLVGAEQFPLPAVFTFPLNEPEAELLPDRITYFLQYPPGGNIPMVSALFIKGYDLDFIRFAVMGNNGFKLYEFKGKVLAVGDVEDMAKKVMTAESVIAELRRTDSLMPSSLFEWGAKWYEDNKDCELPDQIKALIEAFRLFVEADKLEKESMEREGKEHSITLVGILKYLALCNFKLDNLEQAGKIAQLGLIELEKALEESSIIIDPDRLGKRIMEEVVDLVKKEGKYEEYNEDDEEFDEAEIDLEAAQGYLLLMEKDDSRAREISADNFRTLITRVQAAGRLLQRLDDDTVPSASLFQIEDLTKTILYFCWEKLGFGNHWDFWKEGDSMMPYLAVEMNPRKHLEGIMALYQQTSPFKVVDSKDIIRKGVIAFCRETLSRMQ